MVKFWASHLELQIEENLGVTQFQGQFYHVAPLKVIGMETFIMVVDILSDQHLEIHWNQKLDLR